MWVSKHSSRTAPTITFTRRTRVIRDNPRKGAQPADAWLRPPLIVCGLLTPETQREKLLITFEGVCANRRIVLTAGDTGADRRGRPRRPGTRRPGSDAVQADPASRQNGGRLPQTPTTSAQPRAFMRSQRDLQPGN